VTCLWSVLDELDDLTSSTNNILELLSSILVHPQFNCTGYVGLFLFCMQKIALKLHSSLTKTLDFNYYCIYVLSLWLQYYLL